MNRGAWPRDLPRSTITNDVSLIFASRMRRLGKLYRFSNVRRLSATEGTEDTEKSFCPLCPLCPLWLFIHMRTAVSTMALIVISAAGQKMKPSFFVRYFFARYLPIILLSNLGGV